MKKTLLHIALFAVCTTSMAQVGVGTNTPDNSAALEVQSTTKGFLPPRMTQSQIVAISNPAEGLMVYCTDCSPKELYVFDGSFFNNAASTKALVNSVTGAGGAIWMDRNLGASQVATSTTDVAAFGALYQWGRNTDGHQLRTSSQIAGPVNSGNEGLNFITSGSSPFDWLSISDDTRWSAPSKGIHDPCPIGFRVPTESEFNNEVSMWSSQNAAGGFASPLKIPISGSRNSNGTFNNNFGYYWTATTIAQNAVFLFITNGGASHFSAQRAGAYSVRCIKE
jgi:hypothetical protein